MKFRLTDNRLVLARLVPPTPLPITVIRVVARVVSTKDQTKYAKHKIYVDIYFSLQKLATVHYRDVIFIC